MITQNVHHWNRQQRVKQKSSEGIHKKNAPSGNNNNKGKSFTRTQRNNGKRRGNNARTRAGIVAEG